MKIYLSFFLGSFVTLTSFSCEMLLEVNSAHVCHLTQPWIQVLIFLGINIIFYISMSFTLTCLNVWLISFYLSLVR